LSLPIIADSAPHRAQTLEKIMKQALSENKEDGDEEGQQK